MRPLKICTKCHQKKELAEFYIDRNKKDGHRPDCKNCNLKQVKEYRQTEQGKTNRKSYATYYNQTKNGLSARKHYGQTEKGKAALKASHKRSHIRYPKHLKAKQVVNSAIAAGRMPHSNTLQCHCCPEQAEQYHHHKGYAPEYWLDVLPICRKCHRKIHKKEGLE